MQNITLETLHSGSLLLLDKPLDWTSFDAVNFVRKRLCTKFGLKKFKVGHAGTLDPRATGLLLICTGSFTKQAETLQGLPKEYTGTFKLGATTPSYDTEKEEDTFFPTEHITPELLEMARQKFLGEQLQQPPIFSAIKVAGKELYLSARKGITIEVPPRHIRIGRFELTRVEMPYIDFVVECSKGTYIRSLAFDFGQALNSGAYLTALRRTSIGEHKIEDAWTAEGFEGFLNQ